LILKAYRLYDSFEEVQIMKRTLTYTWLLVIGVAVAASAQMKVGGWDPEAVEKAEQTAATFKEKDPGLSKFFESAAGYVVFPSVAKGAMGVGGAHGKGVLFEKGEPIGRSSLTQVTIGFQLGGQAYSEIIFFENDKSLNRFKGGEFELAAQASAVAATVGVSADLAYSGGVAVLTMAKGGLMYEASVGGQKFSYNAYGKDAKPEKEAEKTEPSE